MEKTSYDFERFTSQESFQKNYLIKFYKIFGLNLIFHLVTRGRHSGGPARPDYIQPESGWPDLSPARSGWARTRLFQPDRADSWRAHPGQGWK